MKAVKTYFYRIEIQQNPIIALFTVLKRLFLIKSLNTILIQSLTWN